MFSIGSKKSLNHSMLKAIWSKNAAGRVGLFWASGQAKSKVPSLAISNIHALAWCSIWMFLVFLVPWWQQACQIVQCLKCSIMPSKKNIYPEGSKCFLFHRSCCPPAICSLWLHRLKIVQTWTKNDLRSTVINDQSIIITTQSGHRLINAPF